MNISLESYIEQHIQPEPEYLTEIEIETNLRQINGRMCAGHIQGRLLKMLTGMIAPKRALELGTFTGYSALCIAEGLPKDGVLTTVEIDDELTDTILKNFMKAPCGNKISLVTADALEYCRSLNDDTFDMIFIDAEKRHYPLYLAQCKRILRKGGYIIADNILWDGHVLEKNRHDPRTEGVRQYNRIIAADPDMETVIIPIRDGISISRKRI